MRAGGRVYEDKEYNFIYFNVCEFFTFSHLVLSMVCAEALKPNWIQNVENKDCQGYHLLDLQT